MNQTLRRVFVMLCAGAGVWILVFWLYEPSGPGVSYGGAPGGVRGGGNSLAQLDTIENGPGEDDDDFETLDPTAPRPIVDPAPPTIPVTNPAAAVTGSGAGDAPAGSSNPTFAPRVVAPEFWEYTVQRGDNTWESIAQKTLGDRKLASVVLRANPLVSPDKLIPGRTRLKIPRDPKNIQGKVVNEPVQPTSGGTAGGTGESAVKPAAKPDPAPAAGSGDRKPEPVTPPSPPPSPVPAAGAAKTYTVGKGDTLSTIAKAHLGAASRWREIYELNKGVIADPDHLKLGTVLKIPGEKPKQ